MNLPVIHDQKPASGCPLGPLTAQDTAPLGPVLCLLLSLALTGHTAQPPLPPQSSQAITVFPGSGARHPKRSARIHTAVAASRPLALLTIAPPSTIRIVATNAPYQAGYFQCAVYGLTNGGSYSLQLSTDLQSWSSRASVVDWNQGDAPWPQAIPSPYSKAFFRVINDTQPSGTVTSVTSFGTKDNDTITCSVEVAGGVAVGGTLNGRPFIKTPAFTTAFVGAGSGEVRGLAVDGQGNYYATGWWYGNLDFGGGPQTTLVNGSWGENKIFVLSFTGLGAYRWAHVYGTDGNVDPFQPPKKQGNAIAVDSSGNVAVVGFFDKTVDFGSGAQNAGGFILHLSSAGTFADVRALAGTTPEAAVFDATSALYISGTTAGGDFGFGATTVKGRDDAFIVKYAGDAPIWLRTFGTNLPFRTTASAKSLAVGNALYVGGLFGGTMSFGGADVLWQGRIDGWAAKYDLAGNHIWSKGFGAAGDDSVNGVSVAGNTVVLAGTKTTVTVGAWAIGLNLDGSQRWEKVFPIHTEATTAAGGTISGRFYGALDLGRGTVTSTNNTWDCFSIRLQP